MVYSRSHSRFENQFGIKYQSCLSEMVLKMILDQSNFFGLRLNVTFQYILSCHIKSFGSIHKNLDWSKIILDQQKDSALIFDLNFIS